MSRTNFEPHRKHSEKVLMKSQTLTMNDFTRVCTISLKFEIYFLEFPQESFWYYFRELSIALAFTKYGEYFNTPTIVLVHDLCSLKTEISRYAIGFPLIIPVQYLEYEYGLFSSLSVEN